MNADTGHLRNLQEGERTQENELVIALKDLTSKQREQGFVSLKDTRSYAGKKLQKARKAKQIAKQSKKRNRK